MSAGEISLAQAGVIGGRVAALPQDPDFREQVASALLDLVDNKSYDATDLDRCFTHLATELDTDGLLLATDLSKDLQERGAHGARYLALTPDTLGGVQIKGYTSLEEAELVKTCLMSLAAPATTAPGACGGDPDTGRADPVRRPRPADSGTAAPTRVRPRRQGPPRARRPDVGRPGLGCRRLQHDRRLPHAHATAARLTSTMTSRICATGSTTRTRPPARPFGGRSPAARVRRRHHPRVLGSQGQVLDVGRTSRLVTTGIWLALVAPRPALRLPRLHPAPPRLRRPPHHPLGRRRPHGPAQPGPALSHTPHPDPPNTMASADRPSHPATALDPTTTPSTTTARLTYTPARPRPPLVA